MFAPYGPTYVLITLVLQRCPQKQNLATPTGLIMLPEGRGAPPPLVLDGTASEAAGIAVLT